MGRITLSDNDSTIVQPVASVPMDSAGNLVSSPAGLAEDSAHVAGDKGVMALAVREATATDLSAGATDGDYEPLQVDGSGRLWVDPQGNVAHDGVDTGNPIKVGGKAQSVVPSVVASGDRVDALYSVVGAQVIAGPATVAAVTIAGTMGIGRLVDGAALPLASAPLLYNGATWDSQRSNHEVTVLSSAARTSTNTGSDNTNYNARAAYVVIDITAGSGFGLTPAIQAKDSLSGKYYAVSAALTKLTTTGTYVYLFSSGSSVATGGVTAIGFPLPRLWRLVMTADDATSATYSVAVNYIS